MDVQILTVSILVLNNTNLRILARDIFFQLTFATVFRITEDCLDIAHTLLKNISHDDNSTITLNMYYTHDITLYTLMIIRGVKRKILQPGTYLYLLLNLYRVPVYLGCPRKECSSFTKLRRRIRSEWTFKVNKAGIFFSANFKGNILSQLVDYCRWIIFRSVNAYRFNIPGIMCAVLNMNMIALRKYLLMILEVWDSSCTFTN